MKYIHLFFTWFFAIFVNSASYGQGYIPVVSENAEWTVLKLTIDTQDPTPPFPKDTSYVRTWIAGDTTIADMDFKKVFSSEFLPGDNIPRYQGAIQEENQIVTWIPNERNIEKWDTLYNFNLQIGDTIAYYEAMIPFYHYIQNIDSITLEDGFIRKRILIYTKEEGASGEGELINTWIEGLGELQYGLIYPFCQQSFAPRCLDYLICYKEKEQLVYEYYPLACSVSTFINSEKFTLWDVEVSPNPFDERIRVTLPENKEFSRVIYNIGGITVFNQFYQVKNNDSLEINLSYLKFGTYLFIFKFKKTIISKMVIKK
ncbi:MAG TPA: T9SS type A sorting domain-containing protein [Saprospiraceae bacterium]|nr:T9SS type A sorting domain-containing protein [Saprospiraceae bacterium]HMP13840.1 T9SS type A sorting domain-containing protein [Saprospiraceae bacterium]